jgi:AcrR family transcriptional regulator
MTGMPKRQARGERRIASLLDAAAEVFAEAGYDAATTNAIAARAGVSPGSLYQFFANKDAIAQALAERFVTELAATHAEVFAADLDSLPLDEMLDRVVDPLVAFNLANPSFQLLVAGGPPRAGEAKRPLHVAMLGRVEKLVAARTPGLPPASLRRHAVVIVQVFGAMLPLVLAAAEPERTALVAELKSVLAGYLGRIAA